MRGLRRYTVLILVAGLHGLILFIMLGRHGPTEPADEVDVPISMALLFPKPVEVPVAPPPRVRRLKSAVAATVAPSAPSASTAAVSQVSDEPNPVDWIAEGHKVAEAFAERQGAADPGARASSGKGAVAASPHYAGESYTLSTGQKIIWTSASCYLISDPPDLATPNAFAHLAQARIGCNSSSPPPGELFKQSPAYQQHHPDN